MFYSKNINKRFHDVINKHFNDGNYPDNHDVSIDIILILVIRMNENGRNGLSDFD
jgi:hypothetical protein